MDLVAVCVCTYNRPGQLKRLLDVLSTLDRPPETTFVIVDNGVPDPETGLLVAKFRKTCSARVDYLIERRPGISAARNAAFRAARAAGARAVAMLDDDEWPSAHWLAKLLETQSLTGAAVVGGPVEPVFDTSRKRLKKYKKLWAVQKGSLNGRLHVYCTCNCLIRISAVAELGSEPFPDEFGLTGGEDVVFFRRLHFAGATMAWSDEAVVFEGIPEERATFAWMRRRWYRHGNAGVRCEKAAPDPKGPSPLLKTLLLCGRLPVYPLFRRNALRAPLLWVLECERIRGRIASHLGKVRQDYGRAKNASGAKSASIAVGRD
jgi:succinoglycan biosynthesis protein ExoM